MDDVIKSFHNNVSWGPLCICSCCDQLSGFSIEFCAAVAVIVTGITVIYVAKKAVCIMHVERQHVREAWAPIHKFIWRPYFNVVETSQSDCLVILWSADVLFISTAKTKERYIAKETKSQ